jgi:hypothetical protein
LFTSVGTGTSEASGLIWEVENPFRFFKPTRSFAMHERAFKAARGDPSGPMPADIIWRTERRLNDPACSDSSTADRCAATARKGFEQSRLGWAAQTLGEICYDSNGRPRRYTATCERRYSWGAAKEDYVLPEAHTVAVRVDPAQLTGVTGECTWAWTSRKRGGKVETRRQDCASTLVIARVPFALNAAESGVAVKVDLPDGRALVENDVVVQDLFLVALGDSFASGESNPDRPVTFSASRTMTYDPALLREEVASLPAEPKAGAVTQFGLASGDQFDPKVLPRRLLDDELAERFHPLTSAAFLAAFEKSAARWVSRDCHRSQYGYPFRVGLQLALENRQRAVTLVSLACSGAEVTDGLFLEMSAREGQSEPSGKKVGAQLDKLSDLICRGGPKARTQSATYTLPVYEAGSTRIDQRSVKMAWCPPQSRKRPIDLVMLSIGGNDVGFGALAAYAITEKASDFAPIAGWIGSQIRFGPEVSRTYLNVLDERMKALRDALRDGFGVDPGRVIQTSYEPIQYDETGALCGSQPTLGMDVHPKLRMGKQRLGEISGFMDEFLGRLQCMSTAGGKCPKLATGAGTGFTLVTEHIPAFTKRGICARDPKRALADSINMRMPRRSPDGFKPFTPAYYLPYAHNWRLFRTPNDAFLTANTHREGISPFDILQPAYAGLYSGAIHPTAEAHAIVADYVVRHARAKLGARGHITVRPTVTGSRD